MSGQNSTQNWRYGRALIVLLICVSLFSNLQAHPHIWVDLQITPQFNEHKALTGFSQRWQFDPFYSLVLAEDLQHPNPQRLEELKLDIWQNLEPLNFYTELTVAGQTQSLNPNGGLRLEMDGLNVVLAFDLTLLEPLTAEQLATADVRYRIFEPTYYIDIMHQETQGLIFPKHAAHCEYDIIAPQPSADIRQRALDVDDPNAPVDNSLGQHFAQTVVIQCAN